MKDMVTNGTGNSRYLKTSLASGTTWESALAMLRDGTFPIDLNGLNNGGITQLGSAYSKANVLPDDVCALLGLDSTTAEPKDAFNVVGNPAELWVWEKYNYVATYTIFSDPLARMRIWYTSNGNYGSESNYYVIYEYSNSVSVDENNNVVLVNPQTVKVYKSNAYTNVGVNTLKNKYFKFKIMSSNTGSDFKNGVYYCPSNVTVETTFSVELDVAGIKSVSGVHARNASVSGGLVGYVTGVSSSNYPEDGQSGDYWYIRLGQIGEGMTKIETGSYVGTGTYGSSNPNSLTFGFVPKVVFIYPEEPSQNAAGVVAVYGTIYAIDYATRQDIAIIWSNKQMSWYSMSAPSRQFNDTDVRYIYVAIG